MKPTPFRTVTALTWGGSEVPPGESKASHEMFGWTGDFVTCLREMERTTGPSPWQREEIRPPAPPSPRDVVSSPPTRPPSPSTPPRPYTGLPSHRAGDEADPHPGAGRDTIDGGRVQERAPDTSCSPPVDNC